MSYLKAFFGAILGPHQRHISKLTQNHLKIGHYEHTTTEEKLSRFCVTKKVLWLQQYKLQKFVAMSEMNLSH